MDETARNIGGSLGEYSYTNRERSTSEVVKDILADGQELIRSEVRLARAEVRSEVSKAVSAGVMLAGGAAVGLFGLGFILWSLVYALDGIMPQWLAALLVGIALAIVAAILVSTGKSRMKDVSPTPEKTIESVKENVEWMKNQTKS